MGEYAKIDGREVKIGTCASMYYLRASDRFKVQHVRGNVDPAKDASKLWFRLPHPHESNIYPGEYDSHEAPAVIDLRIDEFDIPDGHGVIQVTNGKGLLLNVPCSREFRAPTEGATVGSTGIRVFRNGGSGGYKVLMLGWRDNGPALLVTCRDCITGLWRLTPDSDPDVWRQFLKGQTPAFRIGLEHEWQSFDPSFRLLVAA